VRGGWNHRVFDNLRLGLRSGRMQRLHAQHDDVPGE
jgi:hypothetical protein